MIPPWLAAALTALLWVLAWRWRGQRVRLICPCAALCTVVSIYVVAKYGLTGGGA